MLWYLRNSHVHLIMARTLNIHLDSLEDDYLYHLALGKKTHDLQDMFGDVRFVCVGGTAKRMKDFAYFIKDQLGIKLPTGVALQDISQNGNRYSMFKIGPVLSVTVCVEQLL